MRDFDQLIITIPAVDGWDEKNECFVTLKEQTLVLKHSLVSLSKWESKWHKPFLSKEKKTEEEMKDYIKCMTITQNVNPDCYSYLTKNNMKEISDYIADPMTATKFYDNKNSSGSGKETITSELIYFWMCNFSIPSEYAKWHLNRLLTLIRVCNVKNTPPKKRSTKELLARNRALNAERKAKMHTNG